MSKSQEATATIDVFGIYEENLNKVFATIHKEAPKFHQSITDLQQQYMQTCENTAKTALSLQREYATKTGITANVPEVALSAIRDTNEEFSRAYSMYSQTIQTAMDTTKQNIKTFNDSAKSFADLNRNIIQSWMNVITPSTPKNQ